METIKKNQKEFIKLKSIVIAMKNSLVLTAGRKRQKEINLKTSTEIIQSE